jgi:hypothetical protein
VTTRPQSRRTPSRPHPQPFMHLHPARRPCQPHHGADTRASELRVDSRDSHADERRRAANSRDHSADRTPPSFTPPRRRILTSETIHPSATRISQPPHASHCPCQSPRVDSRDHDANEKRSDVDPRDDSTDGHGGHTHTYRTTCSGMPPPCSHLHRPIASPCSPHATTCHLATTSQFGTLEAASAQATHAFEKSDLRQRPLSPHPVFQTTPHAPGHPIASPPAFTTVLSLGVYVDSL